MRSFDLVRKFLPTVEPTLAKWESQSVVGRKVVPNIKAERFLSNQDMISLLERLLTVAFDRLEEEYQSACWSLTLHGGQVNGFAYETRVGRAVEREHLISQLADANDIPLSEARHLVERLICREVPVYADNYWMTRHSAWVTWDAREVRDDPFSFLKHNKSDEVRACLGLPSHGVSSSFSTLVLLRYRLEAEVDTMYRPTGSVTFGL